MSLNIYSAFNKLMPSTPKSTVEVLVVLTNGNSQVRTSNGVTITVSGDSVTAGNRAYVIDGSIVGAAPSIITTRVNI